MHNITTHSISSLSRVNSNQRKKNCTKSCLYLFCMCLWVPIQTCFSLSVGIGFFFFVCFFSALNPAFSMWLPISNQLIKIIESIFTRNKTSQICFMRVFWKSSLTLMCRQRLQPCFHSNIKINKRQIKSSNKERYSQSVPNVQNLRQHLHKGKCSELLDAHT